jgi:maltooligosyltrehalose synthase
LSEIPQRWARSVARWSASNAAHRQGGLPDRACEYLFYQTLVGAWPIGIERVLPFLEKANREAKVHTSWTDPDARYERAVRRFAKSALQDLLSAPDLRGGLPLELREQPSPPAEDQPRAAATPPAALRRLGRLRAAPRAR